MAALMYGCFVGVRDYIHVMDLASGHVAALNKLKKEHLRLKVGKLAGIPGFSRKTADI